MSLSRSNGLAEVVVMDFYISKVAMWVKASNGKLNKKKIVGVMEMLIEVMNV